jgi:hypothetical protein
MILDEQIPEIGAYRDAERNLPIRTCDHWAPLVVFGGNQGLPVHSWFRFKEGFSESLLRSIFNEVGEALPRREVTVLDPFCGVGTTLLSAQTFSSRTIHAVGIERNPFIHFVAQTKLRWPEMNAGSLVADGLRAITLSDTLHSELPSISSISKGRCVSIHIARRLTAIAEAANQVGDNRDFVRLGVAANIEGLSRVRRDGRALRIVSKPIRRIEPALRGTWAAMANDVILLKQSHSQARSTCKVILGDGRNPVSSGIADGSVDLIITSPPYPNNIDYSEVYKLELWLLGFVSSGPDFLALRRSTFRSHPTYEKTDGVPPEFNDELRGGTLRTLLGGLLRRLEDSSDAWRGRLLAAYFGDMWRTIRNLKRTLSKNGIAVMVVGNSLHGTDIPALVATDLILAQIAECHGMATRISVARSLKRRLSGNHFLRESVVIMRKD